MIQSLIQVVAVAFLINLVWEISHSYIYKKAIDIPLKQYIPRIVNGALRDGILIMLFYAITVFLFQNENILMSGRQIVTFILVAYLFSYIDDEGRIRKNRWEYEEVMPRIFGVGLMPLIELVFIGVVTFLLVF